MGSFQRVTYVKRYKMEAELSDLPSPDVRSGCSMLPWHWNLMDTHAQVMFGSFEHEIDGKVFPCLSDQLGCKQLMRDIARRPGFVSEATWLMVDDRQVACGTIQGLCERAGVGSIQNVGVLPGYRNLGIGTALLLQALAGFRESGLERASLEVTAENERAIELYARLGFRRRKTIYKAINVTETASESVSVD